MVTSNSTEAHQKTNMLSIQAGATGCRRYNECFKCKPDLIHTSHEWIKNRNFDIWLQLAKCITNFRKSFSSSMWEYISLLAKGTHWKNKECEIFISSHRHRSALIIPSVALIDQNYKKKFHFIRVIIVTRIPNFSHNTAILSFFSLRILIHSIMRPTTCETGRINNRI